MTRRWQRIAGCMLMAVAAQAAASGVPSHCTADEWAVFSCAIEGSSRVVSLCATGEGAPATLVYRFGRLGRVELQYPDDRLDSLSRFRTQHYFRAGVDRREVSFTLGATRYAVFDEYDAAEHPTRIRGVRVGTSDGSASETERPCAGQAISALPRLQDALPCDDAEEMASCGKAGAVGGGDAEPASR